MAAAKKTAASSKAADDDTAQDQRDTAATRDSGPGTRVDAPPEQSARMPAETLNTDPDAAPLAAPEDAHTQTEPEQGHQESSTDHSYAASGGRSIAGEEHVRLVDEEGNPIGVDDLFDDAEPDKTYVLAKQAVIEEFKYPNTDRTVTRRILSAGRRVPRFQAERIKSTVQAEEDANAERGEEAAAKG